MLYAVRDVILNDHRYVHLGLGTRLQRIRQILKRNGPLDAKVIEQTEKKQTSQVKTIEQSLKRNGFLIVNTIERSQLRKK